MEKVGFIGACDKINLIMYVAKALEAIGKKVIVVDTTITQKTKYAVPVINPTKTYITSFENIDFAVGFKNVEDISNYLGIPEGTREKKLPYDYMLIDIDSYKMAEVFEIEEAEENYFVTSFDIYSLRRGVELIKNIKTPMKLSRIFYDYSMRKEDEEYLNYLSLDTKTTWNEFSIYVPITGYDKQIMEENQRVFRLRLKRLSAECLECILYIAQDIVKDMNTNKIRKMIKE